MKKFDKTEWVLVAVSTIAIIFLAGLFMLVGL